MFIDTHCHLDDRRFASVDDVVKSFNNAKVNIAINMGCDEESSSKGMDFCEKYSSIYFACGFHPSEADKFSIEGLERIKELAMHSKCVAIGEIGLDYHWEPFDKNAQAECFTLQIELANSLNLPISVHSRDATKDTLGILSNHKTKAGGVMHCFSGSKETAKTLLDLGFYLGFGGTVTFSNANNLKEVAKYCPSDRILTETDSPYLAPHPLRGSVNEPKNIPLIAKYLADLKGEIEVDFFEKIYKNAKSLFYKIKE